MKGKGLMTDPVSGDLAVKVSRGAGGLITGGVRVGDVTRQNQGFILYRMPGEVKEWPTVCVGITSMLMSGEMLLFKHRIREQLEADGFAVSYMEMEQGADGKLRIPLKAAYK